MADDIGMAEIVNHVALELSLESEDEDKTEEIAASLSGVDRYKDCVFLGADEGAGIERLVDTGTREFGDRSTFPLWQLFELPQPTAGEKDEADVESVSIHKDWLWVATSHALTRAKLKNETGIRKFAEVEFHPRRYVFGRVPLEPDDNGNPLPVPRSGQRRARCVPLSAAGSALTDAIAGDEHLKRALPIPAKENGLDIEGIAVRDERVVLGLRGPVLRGQAVLLDIEWSDDEPGFLKPKADGLPYRKLFIDLDGLGVRDLCRRGDDLLILAGPTGVTTSPFRIFSIHDFFDDPNPPQILTEAAECLCQISPREGSPEGLTVYDKDDGTFLVLLDGTEPEKKTRARGLLIRRREAGDDEPY
jgi:hypothetical protein